VSGTLCVLWHDLECGSYAEDLELWRELALTYGEPILDIGAGAGRVALDLAGRGHEVIALDADAALLAALEVRRAGRPVTTLTADARDYALPDPVPLALVPMQTVQLLGGLRGRLEFLACTHRALRPRGILAVALADPLDGIDFDGATPPLPDMVERDGWVYSSQPVAVLPQPEGTVIERVRETVAPDGARTETLDRIRLDALTPEQLESEAISAGFEPLPRRRIEGTDEYVGSEVVVLRA